MEAGLAAKAAKSVMDELTAERKAKLLSEHAVPKPDSKSGFAGVICVGQKFQARMWVAAKARQQALPGLWETAEEAASWLAYIKDSGLPLPSPKKVRPRSGELCPPALVMLSCLFARSPACLRHCAHLLCVNAMQMAPPQLR